MAIRKPEATSLFIALPLFAFYKVTYPAIWLLNKAAQGLLTVTAELWYQPIGYRWAVNFRAYDAPEPKRFIAYWESMAGESAIVLAKSTATTQGTGVDLWKTPGHR